MYAIMKPLFYILDMRIGVDEEGCFGIVCAIVPCEERFCSYSDCPENTDMYEIPTSFD